MFVPDLRSIDVITPRPTGMHRALWGRYFERRARRRFARVLMRGIEHLDAWSSGGTADRPLLVVANHSAWWDAVFPVIISCRRMRHDAYALMDQEQLARFRFFRRVGVFSVNRADARSAMRTLRYADELLRDTRRVLWIFPQGRIVPNDARPIVCEVGTAHLARMLRRCAIAPVAFRYDVGRDELPIACIDIGPPALLDADDVADPRALTARIAAMIEERLDALREEMLAERLDEFSSALHSIGSRRGGDAGVRRRR